MNTIELLKEHIVLTLERIRKRIKERSSFDFNEFRNIKNTQKRLAYAENKLEDMGEGSSRKVFLLSSKKVLKIATNNLGYAQNEGEVEIYTNPSTKPIVAQVYDHDPIFIG